MGIIYGFTAELNNNKFNAVHFFGISVLCHKYEDLETLSLLTLCRYIRVVSRY